MKTHLGCLFATVLAAPVPGGACRGDEPAKASPWAGALQRPDGQRLPGRLIGGPADYRFAAEGADAPLRLDAGAVIAFNGPGPDPRAASLPFRLELGLGRRLSGRLGAVAEDEVRLESSTASGRLAARRGGIRAVVQRLGEMQAMDDGFESLNATRWRRTGDAEISDDPHAVGERSLRIPAGDSSVTCRLTEPVGSGRLELAFHDDGVVAAGQQCFADLLFRGAAGPETVRAVLGWSEESLSVESPGGPALAVQRLARKPGWHRLSIRFGPAQTEIAVDGNGLAHGKGPGGPLVEIRLASHATGREQAPEGLRAHFDDLRVVRFSEPSGGLEIDPTQDEVRLAGGDQVFGHLVEADDQRLDLRVDGRPVVLPWSDVSGIHFRRVARQSEPVEGLLVRIDWRSAPDDPLELDRADGALAGVSDEAVILTVPYLGALRIPRPSIRRLEVLGRGRRIVIDASAHHLGNEIVGNLLPLDPPQPEGRSLERSIELEAVPPGPAELTLDVVQVAGEAGGLRFADMVQKGELRTNVRVNGRQVDYLNRHISSNNETPERIRLPIPAGALRPGKNLIRLEQVGTAADPDNLDDLGVLEMAVEFPADGTGRVAP